VAPEYLRFVMTRVRLLLITLLLSSVSVAAALGDDYGPTVSAATAEAVAP
jgi:hypothetical protein